MVPVVWCAHFDINKLVNFDLQTGEIYMGFRYLVKRYSIVVFFPTVSFGLIFADWNHTRKWKLQKAALADTESDPQSSSIHRPSKMSYLSAWWNVVGFNKYWACFAIPATGFLLGSWLDRKEVENSTDFRDKSALFGGRRKPGEPPSWPSWQRNI
ncbi:NADH dehydrogenase [ubiquinone] 1 beta subcomplex subunit 1 [Orchesella cincta]|uniref:NADH dehydrogenase [ubiquinone] 1 beta subcomplex subunit 1 n=1 Tax=Orchesella cincta TaxID=48709 RepID=A0A1D2MQA2_ORCCI|nr:NADH dehydrogenase [ubiquinone] 1 beta subcomplex subunit 1 [Orchesella cincta]